jgi:hypothetical protein
MALEKMLNDKTKSIIYTSLKEFESNILILISKNLELRIDFTAAGKYRYASWSKGKPISQKPDLVITNGIVDIQGSAGGASWVFKNKNWTYTVTDAFECEECNASNRMLILEENGIGKSRILMEISK